MPPHLPPMTTAQFAPEATFLSPLPLPQPTHPPPHHLLTQAAVEAAIFVNERHSQSTAGFRITACDAGYKGVLFALCAASGGHVWPALLTKAKGKTWSLEDSATQRPKNSGSVYRRFQKTQAHCRNILNPLYAALCVNVGGALCLPSGWQKCDMIDAIKYNLGLRAQEGLVEVLDVEEPVVDSPAVVLAGKAVSNDGPTVPTVTGMSEEEEDEGEEVVISLRKRAPAVRRPLGWPVVPAWQSDAALLMDFSSVVFLLRPPPPPLKGGAR